MLKILRVVATNIAVFIVLWMSALLMTAVGSDLWKFWIKPLARSTDPRAALPAYSDHKYAARVFLDQKAAKFRYVPFLEWMHETITSETINIDSDGQRRHAQQQPNRSSPTSIGFFGGSTVWGTGVDDNSTIPAFFDQLTDEYEVTNYGERGYTSRQNLDHLINLVTTRRPPQIAVFYNGNNEVLVHCNYTVTRSLNGHAREKRLREALLTAEDSKSAVYEFLLGPFVSLVSQFSGRPKGADELACSNDATRAEAVAEMIVRNWELANLIVSSYGGKFYAFLQPNVHLGSPRVDHLKLSEERQLRSSEFKVVYPLVRRKVSERRLTWVSDLSEALNVNKQLYIDSAHLAPEGNRIIAEHIRSAINRLKPVRGNGS